MTNAMRSTALFSLIICVSSATGQQPKLRETIHIKNQHKPKLAFERVYCVRFSPDGKYLAIASENELRLRELATRKTILHVGSSPYGNAVFSDDGKLLAARGDPFAVWDIVTKKKIAVFRSLTGNYGQERHVMALGPKGRMVASEFPPNDSSKAGRARVWEIMKLDTLRNGLYIECDLKLRFLSFTPDGKNLLVAGNASGFVVNDTKVRTYWNRSEISLWSTRAQRRTEVIYDAKAIEDKRPDTPVRTIDCAAITPDRRWLAVGVHYHVPKKRGFQYEIDIWDLKTRKKRTTLKGIPSGLTQIMGTNPVAISADGKLVAAGTAWYQRPNYAEVYIWNAESGKILTVMQNHKKRVASVSFSPDGKTLATGCWDHHVRLWDLPAVWLGERKRN